MERVKHGCSGNWVGVHMTNGGISITRKKIMTIPRASPVSATSVDNPTLNQLWPPAESEEDDLEVKVLFGLLAILTIAVPARSPCKHYLG
jgi:hypothetical protein